MKLVLLRFLGILLGYRKKDKLGKDAKATDVTDAKLLYVYTAKLLQKETNCVEVCLKLLQTLLKQQEVTHGEVIVELGILLSTNPFIHPSIFFSILLRSRQPLHLALSK